MKYPENLKNVCKQKVRVWTPYFNTNTIQLKFLS